MNAKLVGISICLKKGEAAYIPVSHVGLKENEQITEEK